MRASTAATTNLIAIEPATLVRIRLQPAARASFVAVAARSDADPD